MSQQPEEEASSNCPVGAQSLTKNNNRDIESELSTMTNLSTDLSVSTALEDEEDEEVVLFEDELVERERYLKKKERKERRKRRKKEKEQQRRRKKRAKEKERERKAKQQQSQTKQKQEQKREGKEEEEEEQSKGETSTSGEKENGKEDEEAEEEEEEIEGEEEEGKTHVEAESRKEAEAATTSQSEEEDERVQNAKEEEANNNSPTTHIKKRLPVQPRQQPVQGNSGQGLKFSVMSHLKSILASSTTPLVAREAEEEDLMDELRIQTIRNTLLNKYLSIAEVKEIRHKIMSDPMSWESFFESEDGSGDITCTRPRTPFSRWNIKDEFLLVMMLVAKTSVNVYHDVAVTEGNLEKEFKFCKVYSLLLGGMGEKISVKDYAPVIFHHVRTLCGINPFEYMRAWSHSDIVSEFELDKEGGGDGEEARTGLDSLGQGFVSAYSKDHRYILRTINDLSAKLLLGLLPAYYEHLKRHPNSLLVRYLGLYQLSRKGKKQYFVIVANIFEHNNSKSLNKLYCVKDSKLFAVSRRGRQARALIRSYSDPSLALTLARYGSPTKFSSKKSRSNTTSSSPSKPGHNSPQNDSSRHSPFENHPSLSSSSSFTSSSSFSSLPSSPLFYSGENVSPSSKRKGSIVFRNKVLFKRSTSGHAKSSTWTAASLAALKLSASASSLPTSASIHTNEETNESTETESTGSGSPASASGSPAEKEHPLLQAVSPCRNTYASPPAPKADTPLPSGDKRSFSLNLSFAGGGSKSKDKDSLSRRNQIRMIEAEQTKMLFTRKGSASESDLKEKGDAVPDTDQLLGRKTNELSGEKSKSEGDGVSNIRLDHLERDKWNQVDDENHIPESPRGLHPVDSDTLKLDPQLRNDLLQRLEEDCKFLAQNQLTHYELLIGVKKREKQSKTSPATSQSNGLPTNSQEKTSMVYFVELPRKEVKKKAKPTFKPPQLDAVPAAPVLKTKTSTSPSSDALSSQSVDQSESKMEKGEKNKREGQSEQKHKDCESPTTNDSHKKKKKKKNKGSANQSNHESLVSSAEIEMKDGDASGSSNNNSKNPSPRVSSSKKKKRSNSSEKGNKEETVYFFGLLGMLHRPRSQSRIFNLMGPKTSSPQAYAQQMIRTVSEKLVA